MSLKDVTAQKQRLKLDRLQKCTDFCFTTFFSEEKLIDSKGYVNLPREIIEKVFKDFDLGIYVYDGQKNIYTVTKIDLNKMSQDGVSSY